MIQLYIINGIRRSSAWLEQNGLTPDMPGIYPLADVRPAFDPRLERLIDGGTGGSPEEGFYIGWIVEPLSEKELAANLPPTLAERIAEVMAAYEAAFAPIDALYPVREQQGWPIQKEEARAYMEWHEAGQEGTEPATPVLERLVAERRRGETLADFATVVLKYDKLWPIIYAAFTGQQQRKIKDLNDLADAGNLPGIIAYGVDFVDPPEMDFYRRYFAAASESEAGLND